MGEKKITAGAGRSEIVLPENYFPSNEFTEMKDPLTVRAVYMAGGDEALLVSLEITSLMGEDLDDFRRRAADASGVAEEKIWMTVTHTFDSPHIRPAFMLHTEAEKEKNTELKEAFLKAEENACRQAREKAESAVVRSASTICNINVNRNVLTRDGWWLGHDEEGPSDKTVTAIRIDAESGNPIAVIFSYDIQSAVMQFVKVSSGGCIYSGDIAGWASRDTEKHIPGAIAMFLCGCAGDQVPGLQGRYDRVNPDGALQRIELHDEAISLMHAQGHRLGASAVRAAAAAAEKAPEDAVIAMSREKINLPAQHIEHDLSKLHPCHQYEYTPEGEREATLDVITIGDAAIVATQAELGTETGTRIRSASPYGRTIVATMVNGGAKYMPRRDAYEKNYYEAMNSPFAAGSAEQWEDRAIDLLKQMHQ